MDGSVVFARCRQCAPHLIHESLDQPKSTYQTASRSVQLFLHSSRQTVPILYCNGDLDSPSNIWFLGPTCVHNPNSISICWAIFAGLTSMTDSLTDHSATLCEMVGRICVCTTVLRCGLKRQLSLVVLVLLLTYTAVLWFCCVDWGHVLTGEWWGVCEWWGVSTWVSRGWWSVCDVCGWCRWGRRRMCWQWRMNNWRRPMTRTRHRPSTLSPSRHLSLSLLLSHTLWNLFRVSGPRGEREGVQNYNSIVLVVILNWCIWTSS